MMTFPLSRLPLLASAIVVKHLDVRLLLPLVQMSTRIKNVVKFSRVHIKLSVWPYSIQFVKLIDPGNFVGLQFIVRSKTGQNLKTIPFQPVFSRDLNTRREDEMKGYRRMIDDFVGIFVVESVSFQMATASSYTSCNFLEYAKKSGLKFSEVHAKFIGENNERVFQRLLKVCFYASDLRVYFLNSLENFKFDGLNNHKMETLRVVGAGENTNWFTVDYLCFLIKCTLVEVNRLRWQNEDFNKFLRFWMASDGRVKSVTLQTSMDLASINPQVVMNGIDNRELIRNETFEIQRADGIKAKVTFDDHIFTFEVIYS